MKRLLLILVVLLLFLSGCGSVGPFEQDTGDLWTTYSSPEYRFNHPKHWVIGPPSETQIYPTPEVIIYDPNSNGNFTANVNIIVQSHPFLAPSAQEQAEATTQFFNTPWVATGFENYQQIDFTPVKVGDIQAGISTNEFVMSQNDITIRNQQLFVPFNQRSYIMTLSCKKEDWERHELDFQKIISSFRLIK